MPPGPTAWILLPLVGALIGYVTNRVAVMMIFRPERPRRVLGLTFHGLVPRRQAELAASIGRIVGDHLVQHEDLAQAMSGIDLETFAHHALDRGLGPKLDELRRMPLIGGFLTEQRVADLKAQAVRGILDRREEILLSLEEAVKRDLDVGEMVARKVESFPTPRMESLILEVAGRELRAIELLGGLLGALVGLVQAAILTAL